MCIRDSPKTDGELAQKMLEYNSIVNYGQFQFQFVSKDKEGIAEMCIRDRYLETAKDDQQAYLSELYAATQEQYRHCLLYTSRCV